MHPADAFNTAFDNALTAKTWEERAEFGQTCAQRRNFDEAKLRVMYMASNAFFIQDYFRGSIYGAGEEIFNSTRDLAWVEQ